MSKLSSILGLLLGVIIILLNMVDFQTGQILKAFFNWQAFLVVAGGTLAAAFINYPFSQIRCFFQGFAKIFKEEPANARDSIEEILDLSRIAHSRSLLEIEKHIEKQEDDFLKFSLSEMLVYRDNEQLEQSLHNHLNAMKLRHLRCQDIFNNMATYAPAFGMMGTVMGLIMMMTSQVGAENADAIVGKTENMLNSLLAGMGLALVTTFYGVFIANFIFIPVSGKLKVLSDAEVDKNEVIIQGVLALKNNMPTLFLKESMLSHVSYQTKLQLSQLIR